MPSLIKSKNNIVMGKKQHSKDRLYLTNKEWKEEWGGNKDRSNLPYTRLPFSCCAITFTQFEDPVKINHPSLIN